MSKKLSHFEKYQNKVRRHVLLQVQKMLKDKSIHLDYSYESKLGEHGLVWVNHLTINWRNIAGQPRL